MAVTLSVLGILLAFSAAGLMVWQRNSIYMQNRACAETIFMTAQTALYSERMAGTLGELENYVTAGGPGSGVVPAEQHNTERTLYYLDIIPGKAEEDTAESNVLIQLLRPYVYDFSILDADVRLEFDPADGTVFSVSYCDRTEGFTYGTEETGRILLTPETRRDRQLQKSRFWGYYDTVLSEKINMVKAETSLAKRVSLVNDDMLVLEVELAEKYRDVWMQYQYRINLYDDTDHLAASFLLTADQLKDTDGKPATFHHAEVPVTLYGEDDRCEVTECAMEVTVDAEGKIRILLDGMDLLAAAILEDGLYGANGAVPDGDSFAETCSILRFMDVDEAGTGISADTDYIYAGVCIAASETDQENDPDKKWGRERISNETHPFLVGRDIREGQHYEIQCFRHLFNIRFMESLLRDTGTTRRYCLTETLIWGSADGVIAQGKVFCSALIPGNASAERQKDEKIPSDLNGMSLNGTKFEEDRDTALISADVNCGMRKSNGKLTTWGSCQEYAPFPAIPFLGENCVFTAKNSSGAISEIRNLTLRELEEELDTVHHALGLFRVNLGSLENLVLRDVRVDGKNYTGALAGVNRGLIQNIQILGEAMENSGSGRASARGYVRGINYVGGIAGCGLNLSGEKAGEFLALMNEADVYGKSYVGGITGADRSDFEEASIMISDCRNYGCVEVDESYSMQAKVPFSELNFIGGIAGYLTDGVLERCVSVMGPESGMDRVYEESRFWFVGEDIFLGNFVGGIAGYLKDTRVNECRVDGGLVFGHSFVGGYVGFYVGENGYELDGKLSVNCADVLGWEYVGGITGANAGIDADGEADRETCNNMCLRNWKNQGIILAACGYAGGITGFNSGILVNCVSNTDLSEITPEYIAELGELLHAMDAEGYVGGLTGYNNGRIEADRKQQITCVVNGQDYVGGLIGYQDIDGFLDKEHYILEGGMVTGHSFVGGAVGLNASGRLFDSTEEAAAQNTLRTFPNLISGRAFVGGAVGGILLPDEPGNTCYLTAACENSFGIVSGLKQKRTEGICVGGLIGYMDAISVPQDRMCAMQERAEYLADTVRSDWDSQSGTWTGTGILNILEGADQVPEPGEAVGVKTGHKIVFRNGKVLTQCVEGGLHVGGLLGFAEDSVELDIVNGENRADVKSVGTVALGKDPDFFYSFTGGITGRVGEKTVLENCSSSGKCENAKKAAYYGSLAEVNEGIIRNCEISDVIVERNGIVGGLVGRNGGNGQIVSCLFSGYGSSNEIFGGITGENLGQIRDCRFTKTTSVSAQTAGLTAGVNRGRIYGIEAGKDICLEGNTAGGIAGENGGEICNVVFEGIVTASGQRDACAGGIAGRLIKPDKGQEVRISDCINHGTISDRSVDGHGVCGGLVGTEQRDLDSGITLRLSNCVNTGPVQNGRGTGIYGEHLSCAKAELIRCRNYGYGKSGILGETTDSAGEVLLQYCFGVADLEYPIARLSDAVWDKRSKHNYYFVPEKVNTVSGSLISCERKDSPERGIPLEVTALEAGGWKAGEPVRIPYLSANPCEYDAKDDKRELYEAIDEQLNQVGMDDRIPEMAESITILEGNPLRITWKTVPDAFSYLIDLKVYEEELLQTELPEAGMKLNVPETGTALEEAELLVPVKQDWGEYYLRAEIRVLGDAGGETNGNISEPAFSNAVKLPSVLDVPEVWLEYLYDEEGAFVTVSLDNFGVYSRENILLLETDAGELVRIPLIVENFEPDTGTGSGLGSNRICVDGEKWKKACASAGENGLWKLKARVIPGNQEGYLESAEQILELPPVTDQFLQEQPWGNICHEDEYGRGNLTGNGPENLGCCVLIDGGLYGGTYRSEVLLTDRLTGETLNAETDISSVAVGEQRLVRLDNFSSEARELLWQEVLPEIRVETWLVGTVDNTVYFGRKNSGESTVLTAENGSRYVRQFVETIVDVEAKQEVPVIRQDFREETGFFVFEWDTESETEALYQVRVCGVTEEGERNLVIQSEVQRERQISIASDSWNYAGLELSVAKLGTEIQDDMIRTDSMYAVSAARFAVRQSLPRIQGVSLELSRNNREELMYDIRWKPVEGTEALNALAAYRVYAVLLTEDGSRTRILLGEVSGTDASAPVPELLDCDLETYAGKELEIFVNAVAEVSENGAGFTDAPEGEHLTGIRIPVRKSLPQAKVSVDFSDADMNLADLMIKVESESDTSGGYKIRAGIFDSADETKTCIWPAEGMLETGRLPGTLMLTEYVLHSAGEQDGWNDELAGKILRIYLRAVSDSEISSVWSEPYEFEIPTAEQAEVSAGETVSGNGSERQCNDYSSVPDVRSDCDGAVAADIHSNTA